MIDTNKMDAQMRNLIDAAVSQGKGNRAPEVAKTPPVLRAALDQAEAVRRSGTGASVSRK